MMDGVFRMQGQLSKENRNLKKECEECQAEISVIENENEVLRTKSKDYKDAIHDMRVKLDEGVGQSEGGVTEAKFEELKIVWKQEKRKNTFPLRK